MVTRCSAEFVDMLVRRIFVWRREALKDDEVNNKYPSLLPSEIDSTEEFVKDIVSPLGKLAVLSINNIIDGHMARMGMLRVPRIIYSSPWRIEFYLPTIGHAINMGGCIFPVGGRKKVLLPDSDNPDDRLMLKSLADRMKTNDKFVYGAIMTTEEAMNTANQFSNDAIGGITIPPVIQDELTALTDAVGMLSGLATNQQKEITDLKKRVHDLE